MNDQTCSTQPMTPVNIIGNVVTILAKLILFVSGLFVIILGFIKILSADNPINLLLDLVWVASGVSLCYLGYVIHKK